MEDFLIFDVRFFVSFVFNGLGPCVQFDGLEMGGGGRKSELKMVGN